MDYSSAKDYILRKLEKELPKNLFYHGVHHTLDVLEAAEIIGASEGVSEEDMVLMRTAVLLHDIGYIVRYNHNESVACEIADEILPAYGYTESDLEQIKVLIMSTQVGLEPDTHLEKVMCDADHDYFGREDYREIAQTLYRELAEYGFRHNEKEWLNKQIYFLTHKHKYYTDFSLKHRLPVKKATIRALEEKLADLNGEDLQEN